MIPIRSLHHRLPNSLQVQTTADSFDGVFFFKHLPSSCVTDLASTPACPSSWRPVPQSWLFPSGWAPTMCQRARIITTGYGHQHQAEALVVTGPWAPFLYPIRRHFIRSRSRKIGSLNYRIALKFDRHFSSSAADVPNFRVIRLF